MWPGTAHVPVHDGMTRERFEAEIVPAGRPAVLRGLVADWPIVAAGRESSRALADHLARVPARRPVQAWFGAPALDGRFGYSDDLTGYNHDRHEVALGSLLDFLLATEGEAAAHTAFAGAIPVGEVLPDLLPAIPMPLLDPARDRLTSLWLGGRSRTAAHWDLPQNLACVVAGRRRFTLFPIEQVANLYAGPLDFTLAGQPSSLVDFRAPDPDRFPRFGEAMAAAETATLAPGDALYLPSLWWHHVESLDAIGAMVNFWWRDGPEHLTTPLTALFHAALTMRGMPERERAAWRTLFDHYIFANEDPMPHVPEPARGAFRDATPETVAALRQRLARLLGQ